MTTTTRDNWSTDDITFTGSTEAVYATYAGHDGFPTEPVVEYLPILYAQNAYGDRRMCFLSSKAVRACDIHLAEDMADRCAHAQAARAAKGLLPVGFATGAHWCDARPVYGSDAYVDYGQADDLAWEARQDADERI